MRNTPFETHFNPDFYFADSAFLSDSVPKKIKSKR